MINKSLQRQSEVFFGRFVSNTSMLWFCQQHLSKTQASIISSFAYHNIFENHTEFLIRYCQRILKVGFVKVSQVS